ncbi:MAG: hypothetical protein NT062_25840, partial [Proteobacteria bacterium]|nr:hypothetical protein [Pseudomonadota bacterium]
TTRSFDLAGDGRETFLGLGGGFAYAHRDLDSGRDKFSVLSLIGPRFGLWSRSGALRLDWDVGATGDIAMVQAHVFGNLSLAPALSVLRLRGYYYAGGASARSRFRARMGRWSVEMEGVAYQFWSIDDHSYGGDTDPRDVQDQRAMASMNLGIDVADLRLGLYGDATVRRGTWQMIDRVTTELSGGLGLTAPF